MTYQMGDDYLGPKINGPKLMPDKIGKMKKLGKGRDAITDVACVSAYLSIIYLFF